MTTTAAPTVHAFETAGLGKAPFRFVGMVAQDLCHGEAILNRAEYEQTGIAVTTKPGGSCDYCGTYIVNMYRVRSADGREFKVGADCAHKTGDAGLVRKIREAESKRRAEKAAAARAQKSADLATTLADETVRARLAALPHPTAYRAAQGATLLDYATWMAENAGASGKAGLLKRIKHEMGA